MSQRRFDTSELSPWIAVSFARSAGPGGQHVNKVSTRVSLLFDFEACPLLTGPQKSRLRQHLATRLTRDGRLRIVSQRERTQARNRAAAEQRLVDLLAAALYVPKPRRPTRPTATARARRLQAKRRRGAIKQLRRQRPNIDD